MSRRWTFEEDAILGLQRTTRTCAAIGRKLGRSACAVYCRARRIGCWPTTCDLITSTMAAKLMGVTPQWITSLARRGKIKARRVPGGRWWLFDPKWFKQCTPST